MLASLVMNSMKLTALEDIGRRIEVVNHNYIKADKTILHSLIELAAGKRQSEYTPDTWAVFTAMLEQARAVFAKPNASQGEVDSAMAGLQSAILGLKKVNA